MEKVPMKRYTSMKVGGPARFLAYPEDEADLTAMRERFAGEGIRTRMIGNGTNVIVSDSGVKEALIRLTKVKRTSYRKAAGGAWLEVSGGVSLTGLIRENARRGLSGLEKLFWIPGTVGGAIRMNAGSFGAAVSDPLTEIRIMDGEGKMESLEKKDGDFSYRKSPVRDSDSVVSARFFLGERKKDDIFADMEHVYAERKRRHPMEYPSSGSIFKGVGGEPAWKFIERAGLKGLTVGGAQVSEKHANFIVNLGNAKAEDIRRLIERIKKEVFEKSGVSLEEEVELWGFDA